MGKRKNYKGSFYHIYNRGVDKRAIFKDSHDFKRFFLSLREFNSTETIGSIYERQALKQKKYSDPLVDMVAYAVLPNHFHLLLYARDDNAISLFMQRLATGYTKYFNNKYKRTGALFQGRYKIKHIDNDSYLYQVADFINHNDKVHQFGSRTSKYVKTSLSEYVNKAELVKPCPHLFGVVPDDYKTTSLERLSRTIEERERKKSVGRAYEGVASYLHE